MQHNDLHKAEADSAAQRNRNIADRNPNGKQFQNPDDETDALDFSIKKRKIDFTCSNNLSNQTGTSSSANGHCLRPSRSSPSLLQDHHEPISTIIDRPRYSQDHSNMHRQQLFDIPSRPLTSDAHVTSPDDSRRRNGDHVNGASSESALLKHLNGNQNGHNLTNGNAGAQSFNESKFGLPSYNVTNLPPYQLPFGNGLLPSAQFGTNGLGSNGTSRSVNFQNQLAQSLLTSSSLNQQQQSVIPADQLISQYYQYLLSSQALTSLRQKSALFENLSCSGSSEANLPFVSNVTNLNARFTKDCRSASMDASNHGAGHPNGSTPKAPSPSIFNLVMRQKQSITPHGISNGLATKSDSVNGDSATVSPPQVTSTSHPHVDSPNTPPPSSSGPSPLSSGGLSSNGGCGINGNDLNRSGAPSANGLLASNGATNGNSGRRRCSSPTTSDSGGDGPPTVHGASVASMGRRRSRITTTGTAPTELSNGEESRRVSSGSPGSVHSGSGGISTSTRRRGKSLPDELKDEAYWERRRKNNEAAKRSRDLRRAKEDEVAVKAALLEQENARLRLEVAALKAETERLRQLLLNT